MVVIWGAGYLFWWISASWACGSLWELGVLCCSCLALPGIPWATTASGFKGLAPASSSLQGYTNKCYSYKWVSNSWEMKWFCSPVCLQLVRNFLITCFHHPSKEALRWGCGGSCPTDEKMEASKGWRIYPKYQLINTESGFKYRPGCRPTFVLW